MPGLIPLMLNAERPSSRLSIGLSPTTDKYTSSISAPLPSPSFSSPIAISPRTTHKHPTPAALDFSSVMDLSFPMPKLSPRTSGFPGRKSSVASIGGMSPERTLSRLSCVSPAPSSPAVSSFAMGIEVLGSPNGSPRSRRTMPAPLPSIPYTVSEWGKAIADVKRQFVGRRFRACSARCSEIIDNMRDEAQVEPVYIISLHFYAAAALEMNARPLPISSAFRTSLLQKARTHYLKAQELLKDEDDNMSEDSRRLSLLTSSSTIATPMTTLSRTWTPSMSMCSSSRSPSICSLDDTTPAPTSAPIKKRVTFSCDLEDPVIRPDSPTLGFDDFIGRESPEPVIIPRVPMHITTMPPSALKQPKPVSPTPPKTPATPEPQNLFSDDDVAMGRFCALLTALGTEVTSHLAAVERMLAEPREEEEMRAASPGSGRETPIELFRDNEEMKNLEIRSRIERLRSQGWQRRRFDARKYEVLAESALAELA